MIKHIGRHNNQKVVLIFRQLPSPQEHMALVVYSNTIPSNYHDAFMKVLESDIGQQAKDFADALHRNMFPDGRNMLNTLHHNGWLKKVPANQVIVEANAKSHVRLDELNKIINEMALGDDARDRLKNLDDRAGLQIRDRAQEQGQMSANDLAATADTGAAAPSTDPIPVPAAPVDGVLSDEDIARNTLAQADQMEEQMKTLEGEAKRLREEAYDMAPSLKPKRTRKTAAKKPVAKKTAPKSKSVG